MKRSWKLWLKGLAAATISGGASSLSAGLTATQLAPEQFNMNGGLMLTVKLVAISALVSSILGAAMYLKQSPVPRDETVLPPPAAVVLLLLLCPAFAHASPARIVLDCAKEVEKLNGETNQIEKICEKPEMYFDIGVQFGGIAFNLERPRDVLAGFNAGTGYGWRWAPSFWTLSDAFISVDIFINAGLDLQEDGPDAAQLGLSAMVTLMNIVAGGFGYQWELGFGDRPDQKTPIGILGVVTSF